MTFKDHFSEVSSDYSEFRPGYPDNLFSHLASLCNHQDLAWDCATGSGQAATQLADLFVKVFATDASTNQITNAVRKTGISYAVCQAEASGLRPACVDLICVAQALHWFDFTAFSLEVNRVLKKGGVLAAWSYNLLQVNEDIDQRVSHLYHEILGNYWPFERLLVEDGYTGIELPFDSIECPHFEMTARWDFRNLIGYLNTWSATREYGKKLGENPIEMNYHGLLSAWGDPNQKRVVTWPIKTRIWQKPDS